MFLAEAHYDIDLLIEECVHLFATEADKRAVALLVNWFHQLMVHGRIAEADYAVLEREYHSIQEVRTMLIEAREKEREALRKELRKEVQKEARKEGRKEGRTEGRKEGKLDLIEQILRRRLGDMPPTISDRLRRCTLTQLNSLVNPALDAATWEEFTAALPPVVSKT